MFRRIGRGARHTAALARALLSRPRRELVWRMWALGRALPDIFNQPLPQAMAQLSPTCAACQTLSPAQIRQLADAVAAWQFRSPLGICLRRSLLRYYFLREAGLPVQVVFGARLKRGYAGGDIGGHAWLVLHGQPYHENPADTEGFAVMITYPDEL